MAISEQARKDHDWLAPDELFPYHLSTVKVNDPELIEYFDNFTFVFDEVLGYGKPRHRDPFRGTGGDAGRLPSPQRHARRCPHRGRHPIGVQEIVEQAVPHFRGPW